MEKPSTEYSQPNKFMEEVVKEDEAVHPPYFFQEHCFSTSRLVDEHHLNETASIG